MISLIIPTFNEALRLPESLGKLAKFLENFDQEVEVIISDDNSTDDTVGSASSFKNKIKNLTIIRLEKNRGKGWAVKNGMLKAKGDIAVFADADFSTPIFEITKLIEKINQGYDIAIGSRALKDNLVKKQQNFLRKLMGRSFNLIVKIFAIRGIEDTQCGFKAFNLSTTRHIFEKQVIYDFGFDVELLFLARKQNLKIIEVPTIWYNDPRSSINPIKDSLSMLYDLFKIRMVHSASHNSLVDRFFFQIYKKRTFAKFAIVGLTGAVVDYTSYLVLTRVVNIPPLAANPIAVEIAIIWTFTFNNLWTFSSRNTQRGLLNKFLVFQTVTLGGLMLSQIQILLYTHYFSINDLVGKALSIPIVAIFNYSLNSRWTFKEGTHRKSFVVSYIFLIFILFVLYLLLVKVFTGSFQLFITK